LSFAFEMLRHGQRQEVSRAAEQLEAAGRYAAVVGRQTELPRAEEKDWPAKVQVLCSYCESRGRCPAYREALEGDPPPPNGTFSDVGALVRAREALSAKAKILYRRVGDLDRALVAHLSEGAPIVVDGLEVTQDGAVTTGYANAAAVVQAFVRHAQVPPERAVQELAALVPSDAVAKLREAVQSRLSRVQAAQLDAALAAQAVTSAPKWPKIRVQKKKG
jgi:hypothetical protein